MQGLPSPLLGGSVVPVFRPDVNNGDDKQQASKK
jgi:hypothetical protein